MNETLNQGVMMIFDVIIIGFGIYMFVSAMKMKKTNEPGTMLLTEEEVNKCQNKTELAAFFCWRELVVGGVFVLCGLLRLLDKLVFKVGGALNIIPVILLLAAAFWFFASLQTARAKFIR